MPPRSKSQARFMRAVTSGGVDSDMSRAKAEEFTDGFPTDGLPERSKKGFAKTPKEFFKRSKKKSRKKK